MYRRRRHKGKQFSTLLIHHIVATLFMHPTYEFSQCNISLYIMSIIFFPVSAAPMYFKLNVVFNSVVFFLYVGLFAFSLRTKTFINGWNKL